jgi:hypothetical protein
LRSRSSLGGGLLDEEIACSSGPHSETSAGPRAPSGRRRRQRQPARRPYAVLTYAETAHASPDLPAERRFARSAAPGRPSRDVRSSNGLSAFSAFSARSCRSSRASALPRLVGSPRTPQRQLHVCLVCMVRPVAQSSRPATLPASLFRSENAERPSQGREIGPHCLRRERTVMSAAPRPASSTAAWAPDYRPTTHVGRVRAWVPAPTHAPAIRECLFKAGVARHGSPAETSRTELGDPLRRRQREPPESAAEADPADLR